MALSKVGIPTIEVWDADEVAPENIGGQAFPDNLLGMHKVEAVTHLCTSFTKIIQRPRMFGPKNKIDADIVVVGVDNMWGREMVYEAFLQSKRAKVLIDGRIGGLWWRVCSADKAHKKSLDAYGRSLYPQADGIQLSCAQGPTIDVALSVVAQIVQTVRDYLNGASPYHVITGSRATIL